MRRVMSGGLRRRVGTGAILLAVALASAGCGSDSDDAATPADSTSDSPAATPGEATSEPAGETPSEPADEPADDAATIEITVTDGEITPNGEEVEVGVGEEVDLVVTADAPGEIHVHSDPETTIEYAGTGEPETFPLTIDRPGQVEVESHTLEKLIVNLVVS